MVQCSWDRHHDAHESRNDSKNSSAQTMVRQRIQHLGTGEDMESDEKDIVGQQHKCGEDIGSTTLSKDIVSEITCRELLGQVLCIISCHSRKETYRYL